MKKLLVDIVQLADEHRAAIRDAARRRGYEARFTDGDAARARAEAADAEIIFGPNPDLPGVASNLRWLCVPSAGVEAYLPRERYANPSAVLTNASGAYGVTIAEHIVMVTLEMMRRQPEYARVVARRGWRRDLPIRSIRGSRVTLLGTGDIGREAALRLRAFGPESIVGVNRSGRAREGLFDRVLKVSGLDEILPRTDLLVMSLPDTRESAGLMDARRLALLPEGAFLVNVGRGSTIDQKALVALMRGGRLSGAALDVFAEEPLPPEDDVWDCPRLLVTPHVAGNMTLRYTLDRIVDMFLEDFENYCEGRPLLQEVDRERGY